MADSFVSKLITELTAKTTAADTDLVPIADSNGNFFKMTWQKMKQLLLGTKDISGVGDGTVTGAISELNTKINNTGESVASVLFGVQDHWVISTMIPLENADTYNITINQMERYGTTDRPVFEWNVMKYKHGFVILNNNADMSYYFGEAHANKIFTVTFTVS